MTPGYAIVRLDLFHKDVSLEQMITVKKILLDLDQAKKEVTRLNELNSDKGCHYFWQYTIIETGII